MRLHSIEGVTWKGLCYDPATGLPRAADCFHVQLTVGNSRHLAAVEMTLLAGELIDYALAGQLPSSATAQRIQLANRAIEAFVESQLERGWDPVRGPRLILDA